MPYSFHRIVASLGALLLCAAHLVAAAPSRPNLVYGLQDQRPPVARVNETWSWTLLPGTFNASSGTTVSLSSRELPSWASFDAATATFTGLPRTADLGSTQVTVQANASGVALGRADSFTLLVVDGPAPYTRLSLAAQLPSASSFGGGATYTADGALKIPPTWSFSLGFQQYTFEDEFRNQIYYTAYQTGTTELPYWLNFDSNTVTFDGVAPETLGEASITVFGSNVFGYGDIEETFRLVVASHVFEMIGELPALNTTPSDEVSYVVPLTNLRIDNSTVSAANLSSVSVDLSNFTYLAFDATRRTISGTLPSTLAPAELPIPVTFVDQYNDTLLTNLSLAIFSSLFTASTLPALNVTTGERFLGDVSAFTTSNGANYSAAISPASAERWIKFDPSSLQLSGMAPTAAQDVNIRLSGTDPVTGVDSDATLVLAVRAAPVSSETPPSSSTTASAIPNSSGTPSSHSSGLSRSSRLAIGLTLGLVLGLLLLILLGCCWRRRSSKDEQDRRMRRDGSSLIINTSTPDPNWHAEATKGNQSVLSSTVVGSTQDGKFDDANEEKTKSKWSVPVQDPIEARRTILDSNDAQADAAAAVAGTAQAVALTSSSSKPRRFDLMGLFKPNPMPPKLDPSTISLPVPASQSSLYGLGIGDGSPNGSNMVVVRDGQSVTFSPRQAGDSSSVERIADGESDLERSSSWESCGSSSLFYSEGSDSDGVRRSARQPRPPPSAPRQRRDFLPLPIRVPSPSPSPSSSQPSLTPASSRSSFSSPLRNGGIRLVGSHSLSSHDSNGGAADNLSNGGLGSDLSSTWDRSGIQSSSNSIDALDNPHYVPFTSERTTVQSLPPSAHASQTALHDPTRRNSAIEDADESLFDHRPRSGVYAPSHLQGSPTTSAVIFNAPRDTNSGWQSPSGYSEYSGSGWASPTQGEGVRLVGSVAGSPFLREPPTPLSPFPPTPRSPYQHHQRTTSYVDPIRINVNVGEPFRFTPTCNPPPFVSISSSPGRGSPPRATYHACVSSLSNVCFISSCCPDTCSSHRSAISIRRATRATIDSPFPIGSTSMVVLLRSLVLQDGSTLVSCLCSSRSAEERLGRPLAGDREARNDDQMQTRRRRLWHGTRLKVSLASCLFCDDLGFSSYL